MQVLKKKLRDKEAELRESRAETQQREHELTTKERIIAERDAVVSDLERHITRLKAELASSVDLPISDDANHADTEVFSLVSFSVSPGCHKTLR